ncbi:MAG TPA: hypothetical protein VGE67_08320 [Haloferula sp.]
MPTPPERFLDAATRTFGDNAELQVVARRELEAMLDPSASDATEEAAKRLDAADQSARPRLKRYLAGAIATVSLLIASWTTWGIYQNWDELRWFDGDWDEKVATKWIRTLPPNDQLILVGDPDASSREEGLKKLWKSDPEDLRYLADYSRESLKELKTLPPGFAEITARLDPDNGYFQLLQAHDPKLPSSVDEKPSSKPRKRGDPPEITQWTIVDEARWQASLDQIQRAASMPSYDPYLEVLLKQRLDLLPPPTDIMSLAPLFQYRFGMRTWVPDSRLWWIVSAKAEDCLKKGDKEGLIKLRHDWDRIVRASVSTANPTLMTMVIHRSMAGSPLGNFIASAEGLGLIEEAAMLKERKERLSRDNSPIHRAMGDEAPKRHLNDRAGFLKGSTFSHRIPSDEELKPGRLAEYEWFGRIGALVAWLFLALASLFVWSYRFRSAGPVKRISRRLKDLVTARDHLWIIGAGIGLPLLFSYLGTYLTPLGARDWSFSVHGGTVSVGQLLASLLLVLLLPVLIARMKLGNQAGFLGLKSGACIGGWIAVAACVTAWILFGVAQLTAGPHGLLRGSDSSGFGPGDFFDLAPDRAHGPGAIRLWIAEGLLALSLLYLLTGAARSVFSKHRHLIRRSILARLILPAYIAALIVFAVAMPLHHAAERHWVARDALLRLTPANNGLPTLEAELALIDRAQLLEALASP